MGILLDGLLVLITLSGGALCLVGIGAYRRWDQLGVGALAAFATILGIGNVVSGILGLAIGPGAGNASLPLWGQLAIFFWAASAVPWMLFSLQYTGRQTRIRPRTVVLLYVPFVGFAINIAYNTVGFSNTSVVDLVTSVIFIYCLGLVFLGVFLVVQAAYSYVHLSVQQGATIAATPVIVVLSGNSIGVIAQTSLTLATAQYAFAVALGTTLFGYALLRNPILERTPAVETIGEGAIMRETDDLIFLADETGTIVTSDTTATETLRSSPMPGDSVAETLEDDPTTLETIDTVELETTSGKRQYDPQVAPISDHRGEELGTVISLRDVTDRGLREQRLSVLNRVLRHNLRNNVDVLNSHAEVLDEKYDDDHVTEITAAADSISDLGHHARTIDQFISHSGASDRTDVVDIVETTWNDLDTDCSGVAVEFTLPETAPVETSQQALAAAVESALDNAVSYADSAVNVAVEPDGEGYKVVISDDGPGIPDLEIESLDTGTETPLQHGTGLGLWQLQWAVTTLGGSLSFDTGDGTTVSFTVPDRSSPEQ